MAVYNQHDPNVLDQQRTGELDDMHSVDIEDGGVRTTKFLSDDPQFVIEQGVMKQETEEFQRFKRQNITKWGTISQLIS